MKLLLDTADLEKIERALEIYPISGVTTNPTILAREGVDPIQRVKDIETLIGDRTLHVQVTGKTCEAMLREAEAIHAIGALIHIKVPVTIEGLKAIKTLKKNGSRVTATAIYSTIQAELAALSGADYLALYYNRMVQNGTDANRSIAQVAKFIKDGRLDSQILGASFKKVQQLTDAYENGAHALTVSPDLLDQALSDPAVDLAVENFGKDWRNAFGDKTVADF